MGNQDLNPLTPCPPEDETPCTEPAEVSTGEKLLVTDPTSKCTKVLEAEGNSIPHTDGTEVKNKDGSSLSQIVLDKLQQFLGSFPFIGAQNGSGGLGAVPATSDCRPHVLVASEGSWEQVPLEQNSCWEEICECPPETIAGFVEQEDCNGNKHYCLVRTSIESIQTEPISIFFQSSPCIQVSGDGSAGSPYRFDVKISAYENNCITCRSDGLYVECGGVYGGSDPAEEL